MNKPEVKVYSYFSVEKMYSVIVWKIIIEQLPLDELRQLSKQLIEFAENEVEKMGIEVALNGEESILIFPKDGVLNIIYYGQCMNDEETTNKIISSGKKQVNFEEEVRIEE
jgi:hypothetical protein